MIFRSKNHALSTVLTTVIILVASVVLASGVVLYGASLFQGGTQQEAISVSRAKVWVHATDTNGLAWGAAGIRNIGDRVLSIDKIEIRGIDVPFTQWYTDTSITPTLFQQALNHTGWSGVAGMLVDQATCAGNEVIEIDGGSATDDICANAGVGPVSITPGDSVIIYFKLVNGTINALDSGEKTSVGIFASETGAPRSVTIEGIS